MDTVRGMRWGGCQEVQGRDGPWSVGQQACVRILNFGEPAPSSPPAGLLTGQVVPAHKFPHSWRCQTSPKEPSPQRWGRGPPRAPHPSPRCAAHQSPPGKRKRGGGKVPRWSAQNVETMHTVQCQLPPTTNQAVAWGGRAKVGSTAGRKAAACLARDARITTPTVPMQVRHGAGTPTAQADPPGSPCPSSRLASQSWHAPARHRQHGSSLGAGQALATI